LGCRLREGETINAPVMLQQIREYARRNESLGFGTTLSGRAYEAELRHLAAQRDSHPYLWMDRC